MREVGWSLKQSEMVFFVFRSPWGSSVLVAKLCGRNPCFRLRLGTTSVNITTAKNMQETNGSCISFWNTCITVIIQRAIVGILKVWELASKFLILVVLYALGISQSGNDFPILFPRARPTKISCEVSVWREGCRGTGAEPARLALGRGEQASRFRDRPDRPLGTKHCYI